MNLATLKDSELIDSTISAVSEERRITLEVLHHLLEVDRRRLYADRGFSSLWEFATKSLGYSEGAAYRRISAMRLLKKVPNVGSKLASGELSLTVAAQTETFSRKAQLKASEVVEIVNGQSARETERTFLSLLPSQIPLEKVRALTDEHTEIRLVIDRNLKAKLDSVRSLMSHKNPNMNYVEVVGNMADFTISKLDPNKRRSGAPSAENVDKSAEHMPVPRAIPAERRREVWQRDQGQCTYKDKTTGRRCDSKHLLEIDHILPWSLGGNHDLANLRLLCRTHNQYEAQKRFGQRVSRHWRDRSD